VHEHEHLRASLFGEDEFPEAVFALLDVLFEVVLVALERLDLILARLLLAVQLRLDVRLGRQQEHPPNGLVHRRLVGQRGNLLKD
jgi:hypothetical protein